MDLVYVGKIVNTHGIKGELRILSDIDNKDQIFKVGNVFNIDGIDYVVKSYRHHKCFEMVTLNDFNNINDVLFLVGKKVFINRNSIEVDLIYNDYIGLDVIINNEFVGTVKDYIVGANPLLEVDNNNKSYYIPLKGDFIIDVDTTNKKLICNESVRGLF